ncbi:MAG: DNA polymerase III subunit epsilon [Cellvibrionales bacterium TMED49]|nr:DNA polymerase III subunit epsilon [Porticoccaceae bacterium]OUU36966.1 MAG: DNA polymerase III subunit epsilon [Cellvibrionales bacterium TMED49]
MRQIVLDTETTGLEISQNHRIIEIGAVELVNRKFTGKNFHRYINPERDIDEGAMAVHGISSEFLADKPTFQLIAKELFDFLKGSELVIHNAPFDVGFLNHEIAKLPDNYGLIETNCNIFDTLTMARKLHPGQRNNLDALCKRYSVDNSGRELHGALLDAEILADVYLLMSGGQVDMNINPSFGNDRSPLDANTPLSRISSDRPTLPIISATKDEKILHDKKLENLRSLTGKCLWLDLGI